MDTVRWGYFFADVALLFGYAYALCGLSRGGGRCGRGRVATMKRRSVRTAANAAVACAIGAVFCFVPAPVAFSQELTMPAEQFKRLDQFEAHSLQKADSTFGKAIQTRERRGELLVQASKEYDAFIKEYPKSVAVPFALYRKARCLHLDEKRFQAIKAYNEILDYFPNDVAYAAPALYLIGRANWESGDKLDARKAWAEMAEDKDYSRHPLAGDAIVQLAAYLVERNEVPKALEYYTRAGVEFRQKNPVAAQQAINTLANYYTRTKPDEAMLRELYRKFQTFGQPATVTEDLSKNLDYWNTIRALVNGNGQFTEEQATERDKYYKYWAGATDKLFLANDDFRIDVANWHLAYERKNENWFKRLDEQFNAYQKGNDFDRILKWVALYYQFKAKVTEYYSKLDFAKMNQGQIRSLMEVLYDRVKDSDMAKRVFLMIKIDKLTDADKASLAKYFYVKDAEIVLMICDKFDDMDWGKMEKLRFFVLKKNSKDGLPLSEEMVKVEKFAKEAQWAKGDFLYGDKKFEDAIVAYRSVDEQPKNLWRIVDCYKALRQMDSAIQQLREIEGFFVPVAPKAAIEVAHVYNHFGQRALYVSELRNVLKKYPKSGESSQAHQELEALGERIGGAVDERDR
jgi:TolA-binding protein